MYKILIVEDDTITAEYLKQILEKQGWLVVEIVDNATDALFCIKKYNPHLVLMDIMINGPKSGCEVAIDTRKISNCSIVFTTAYADEEMINYAMEVNADGYIVKPYKKEEIIATISLLAAKSNQIKNHQNISKIIGGFYFNHEENLLYKDTDIIKLGPKALHVIQLLCHHKNSYVSYENLYEAIWGNELSLKKLQMLICRIRETCDVDFIENINSVGYKIKLDHSFS